MISNQLKTFQYRPAIDGLRAIAVLAVIIFHLNHAWLPGGFVGVDVFFVISGYLITSIILRDCESSNFSLARFYQRRIARIFPAFFTVALCTFLGAYLIYTPQDFASAGASLSAASLSIANMKYMLQGTYFEVLPDSQPYLHFWSLSVEEQFYMFFPVIYLLIFKFIKSKQVIVLTAIGLISLVICVVMTSWRPVWAFYLLPTRGWQLLAGCTLAVVTSYQLLPSNRWSRYLPPIGLILIGTSFLIIHEGPQFPGLWALLPTLGAIGVLYPRNYSDRTEQYLSHPWLVTIGRMSYSLYLWHWPIFSLVDYQLYMSPLWLRLALKISLSVAASALSLKFIEAPTRSFLNRRNQRALAFISVSVVLLFCLILGIWARKTNYIDATHRNIANGGLIFESTPNNGTVILMGDSNASMYGKSIREVCRQLNRKLIVVSMAAEDALPSLDGNNSELWTDALKIVEKEKPDFVILACLWSYTLDANEQRFDKALQSIIPHTDHLIVFNQPPTLPDNATRGDIRQGARPPFHENKIARSSRLNENTYLKVTMSTKPKTFMLDVASIFENANREIRFNDEKGRLMYHDKFHLSGHGADLIKPYLIELLSK